MDAPPGRSPDGAVPHIQRRQLDVARIHTVWARLAHVVAELPPATAPITVHHADARALPLPAASVDLVLTSPPYINVHNYHQQCRGSVEALHWDVLPLARSEIGANRHNRGNRFRTVGQYALDMALVLCEMVRVVRNDGQLILVVGRESTVLGTPFSNGALVAEIAVQGVGLDLTRRQSRSFCNRYGKRIYEDILHFRPDSAGAGDADMALVAARAVVTQVLTASWALVPAAAQGALEAALAALPGLPPTPLPAEVGLGHSRGPGGGLGVCAPYLRGR